MATRAFILIETAVGKTRDVANTFTTSVYYVNGVIFAKGAGYRLVESHS